MKKQARDLVLGLIAVFLCAYCAVSFNQVIIGWDLLIRFPALILNAALVITCPLLILLRNKEPIENYGFKEKD